MASNALNTATAGLRVTQAAIGVVSQNIANVGTSGYVKRTLSTVSTGVGNSSVATGMINRNLDEAAQTQLRLETSGASYTGLIANVRGQLDKLYGNPGSPTALDGVVNSFAQSLQGLAADPTSPPARSTVVDSASNLASKIGTIAQGVQSLRGMTEKQIAIDVRDANAILSSIATLNTKISATFDDAAKADLLDQRDQKVTALSSYLDVKSIPQRDGTATIVSGSGLTLVERGGATTLKFDERPSLAADAVYSKVPSERGVGTITATQPGGATIDLIGTNAIRSGSLAAGIELRDTILVQAQTQLDDLAAGLARTFSDKTVVGTQTTSGGFELDPSGMQVGNAITIPVNVGGKDIFVTLVASNQDSAPVDPSLTTDSSIYTQTFKISGDPPTYDVNDVQDALDKVSLRFSGNGQLPLPTLTASGGGAQLTITGTSGATVTGASASVTVPTPDNQTLTGQPQFALFVDGPSNKLFTGSLDGPAQLTGFAQRIKINPTVAKDTSSLVKISPGTLNGDTTRPEFLYDALTATDRAFSAASGIGGVKARFSDSVQGFAQRIVDAQGAAAANAQDLDEGQGIALSAARSRYASEAGVKIDDEMSNLIQLQTAYSANARVLTAARDMLDTLMRI
ncbi:MAG: flagellar hook-associated protein FlgK [Methylobacterium sp.]|uniref:flagellar hook-associated protein FlgK n=1 Tax=Methylobacterium sp. TaxID=409 RepID=UPI0025E91EEC|nr:flagellar hook-associated protein FlgK [Methylobacterium sp.]MBX9932316.1 flagellar hook-associated protein FlgK [Methylobacterium sp.]